MLSLHGKGGAGSAWAERANLNFDFNVHNNPWSSLSDQCPSARPRPNSLVTPSASDKALVIHENNLESDLKALFKRLVEEREPASQTALATVGEIARDLSPRCKVKDRKLVTGEVGSSSSPKAKTF